MANYYWERYNAVSNYDYKITQGTEIIGNNVWNISIPSPIHSTSPQILLHQVFCDGLMYATKGNWTFRESLDVYLDATVLNGNVNLFNLIDINIEYLKDFYNVYGDRTVYLRNRSTGEMYIAVPTLNKQTQPSSLYGIAYVRFYRLTFTANIIGYSKGSYITTIQADENAYVHNARNSDGYWYLRGAKVNNQPNYTQIPTQSTKKNESTTVNLLNYFSDPDGNPLTFSASSNNTGLATATVSGNTLTLTGKDIGSVWVTVSASDGSLSTSQGFTLNVVNSIPTIVVTSPSSNMTLYENDLLNISGTAADVNANQSVTIYAQVNNEQRIALAVGLSNAPIPFNKQLKFIGGKLYDGDTPITGNLTDGLPHILKIWAQDGGGGQSAITERAFYVVPNRPPILTVDIVQPNGIINSDKFTVKGDASDPDGNSVTAAYRVNGGNSVNLQITDGKWAFDIALAQLQVGLNTIVVELIDSYNFKVSKTIKLNKDEVKTPISQSVARYKIEPPKGSAKGVLLWVQRDKELPNLKVELSMTLQGEQESYVTLKATNTAPVDSAIVEDEFYHEAAEAKNNIILKLSTSRADINIDHKIHLISGVLE